MSCFGITTNVTDLRKIVANCLMQGYKPELLLCDIDTPLDEALYI